MRGIFLGHPIISAARAEGVQKWIGITLSYVFDDKRYSKGFKADAILQYDKHLKEGSKERVIPLVIDYPRHWRLKRSTSIVEAINRLNTDEAHSEYYENTLSFFKFSEDNHDWWTKDPNYVKEIERRRQQA